IKSITWFRSYSLAFVISFGHYSGFNSYTYSTSFAFDKTSKASLGFERFIMQILGLSNIREAIYLPRDMKRMIP
ncbi:MAG TPA: hypothetical protein PKJ86_02895, partial [Candidatus Dojkabacteria bacterium]|nr:hypothetical protein [Candidatus Dojkabacteria bacterium]